jgi:hypothetical protein
MKHYHVVETKLKSSRCYPLAHAVDQRKDSSYSRVATPLLCMHDDGYTVGLE